MPHLTQEQLQKRSDETIEQYNARIAALNLQQQPTNISLATTPSPLATAPAVPGVPTTPSPLATAPAVPGVPTTPSPLATAPSPLAYVVQPGDTLSRIAQRFGTSIQNITGFRSGDPKLIFPGETLTIGQPAPQPIQPKPTAVAALTPAAEPEILPEEPIEKSREEQVLDFLKERFGVSVSGIDLITQPQKTIKDITTEIMEAAGLPQAQAQIENLSKEVENLENERNQKIIEINDNPFLSEATRQKKVNKVTEDFKGRIEARTNRLKLVQGIAEDARQTAVSAATIFGQQARLRQDQIEFIIEQAESALEAKRKLGEPVGETERAFQREFGRLPTFSELQKIKKPTEAELQIEEAKSIENILFQSRGKDGFVDPKIYLQQKTKSRMSPSEFNGRFGHLLSPKEQERLGILGVAAQKEAIETAEMGGGFLNWLGTYF